MSDLYLPGSGLEVPGIEAVLEYGDAASYVRGGIPGALRINDRSTLDHVHVSELSGLHDDPDVSDSRAERAGHFGERAGILLPRGRTVGITGQVRAGNVKRMRDLWRRMRAQFARVDRDLIIHPPGEAAGYLNEVWSESATGWVGTLQTIGGATTPTPTVFTDGTLTGLQFAPTGLAASANQVILKSSVDPVPWAGEDLWMTAVVSASAAAATPTSIALAGIFIDSAGATVGTWTATTTGVIATPAVGSYYLLAARMFASTSTIAGADRVIPAVIMATPATAGSYTLRAARVSAVLLESDDPSPAGYVGRLPGFEHEAVVGKSRSYGPCFAVNQVSDPDVTSAATWANDSTAGATVDVAGGIVRSWPGDRRRATSWTISNPNTTSRTLAVRTAASPAPFIVAGGRQYRAHVRLRINESFTDGALQVVWTDKSGTAISTSTIDVFGAVGVGAPSVDVLLDGVVEAPDLALSAYLRIASLVPSVVSGNKLAILIVEPRFVDVSEYDPGPVAIDATVPQEIGVLGYSPTRTGAAIVLSPRGAIRRVPRPFLLQGVRSTWDAKAPESQRNLQARRDFTMSLRSSDPRIYSIDERRAYLQLSGSAAISQPSSSLKQSLATPWATVASDNFTGTTSGAALNARVAPVGGTWATSGDATDFVFSDVIWIAPGSESLARTGGSGSGGRHAVVGSVNYTDTDVSVTTYNAGGATDVLMAVVARWVNATNHLRLVIPSAYPVFIRIEQVVAGVVTVLGTAATSIDSNTVARIRLTVYASGRVVGQVLTLSGSNPLSALVEGFSTALASGGALQSGKPGLWDLRTSAGSEIRYYDDFVTTAPAVSPTASHPNFTYEGASLDPKVAWKPSQLGGTFPLDGVGLGSYETSAHPTAGYLTQDSLGRMYYSAGALTYGTPQVTVSGNCIFGSGFDYDLFEDSFIGSAWQYNYIGALLKRVSSTTWLEVRYNSANSVQMTPFGASPPFSLELWCSHTAAGASGTTRLAAWDVPVANIIDGTRKHLRAFMDPAGVIYVELWDFNAPNFNDVGLIARNTFTISGGLSAVIGPTILGRAGMMARLARWDNGAGAGISIEEMLLNYGAPYLSSFEVVDFTSALQLLNCPVIGDADNVPLRLELRGGVVAPIISLSSLEAAQSASISLSSTFTDADPVTVDMDAGTIRSASGTNHFDRRQLGSRFFSLAPGQNIITVQAAGWDSAAPAHVIATWRDALR